MHAVRTVGGQQIGEEIGRGDGFRRVERRHQVVGRIAEDVAAEALQPWDAGPAVVVLDDEPGNAILVVDGLHDARHLVERVGHPLARLVDEIGAGGPGHDDVGDPGNAVEPPALVLHRGRRAAEEIVGIPVGAASSSDPSCKRRAGSNQPAPIQRPA